jgi:predicted heme/steroid binding protein
MTAIASYSQTTKYTIQPITLKEIKVDGGLQGVCSVQEITKSTTSFNFILDSGIGYVKINGQVYSTSILTTWDDGFLSFVGEKFNVNLELLEEITETKFKVKMEVSTNGDISVGKSPELIMSKELIYTELP